MVKFYEKLWYSQKITSNILQLISRDNPKIEKVQENVKATFADKLKNTFSGVKYGLRVAELEKGFKR